MQALLRYQRNQRRAVAQEWARRSNAGQGAARARREADFDTLRMRSLHDRKGTVLREGCTYRGDGSIVPWRIRHSLRGRTDQFDVLVGGYVWRTCGRRKLPNFLRNISA